MGETQHEMNERRAHRRRIIIVAGLALLLTAWILAGYPPLGEGMRVDQRRQTRTALVQSRIGDPLPGVIVRVVSVRQPPWAGPGGGRFTHSISCTDADGRVNFFVDGITSSTVVVGSEFGVRGGQLKNGVIVVATSAEDEMTERDRDVARNFLAESLEHLARYEYVGCDDIEAAIRIHLKALTAPPPEDEETQEQ